MTRLLAFADTQIGVPTVQLADQRAVLDKIVKVALDRQVDAVLHGGDVFEGPVVTPEHLRCFLDGVAPLRDAGVPLLVIRGNGRHDLATRSVHALDVLREIPGIQVADQPTVAVLADKVVVCALPWVHPGRLIAQSNGSLTHDEANVTTGELLVRIARHLYESAVMRTGPGFGLPIVLLAHWAISGASLPTGIPVDDMREPVLSWPDLDAIGFDVVIGAHIHQPQKISKDGLDRTFGFVCGSPQQLNFGESGDHGCWIVDVDEQGCTTEFVPIDSPQFVTIDLGHVDPDIVSREVDWDLKGQYVRVRYTATEDEARSFSHDWLRARLNAAKVASVKIEPTIIRQQRSRVEQVSDQITAIEALREFCRAHNIDAPVRERMLDTLREWRQS